MASRSLQLIDQIAATLPPPRHLPLLPRSPFVDSAGRILDVEKNIRFEREQRAGMHQPPAAPCSAPATRSIMHDDVCKCGHAMAAHKVAA